MRKKMALFLALLMMIAGSVFVIISQDKKVWLSCAEGNQISVDVFAGLRQKTVKAWEVEGKKYFFLPAFVDHNIYIDEKDICVNGIKYGKGDEFTWEEDTTYKINEDDVVFVKSENVPTVFIETDSGSMDMIERGGEDYLEAGSIDVILSNGQVEYSGELERISLRGNSTRDYPKKPYAIKLKNAQALCGMSQLKRWNLLAGWREGCKMSNKIAHDMAQAMGLRNSVSSTWVDLYLNGNYNGTYLLCETVTVGENSIPIHDLAKDNEAVNCDLETASVGRTENMNWYEINDGGDLTGGYLLEKEYLPYYELQTNGFITQHGQPFIIKEPYCASRKQVAYIKNYVDYVEKLILDRDEEYREYIDIDGFTKKFLVDEISLNYDTGVTSMYLYKDRGDDLLYGGPVWDYDSAFGSGKLFSNTPWDSYTTTVLENNVEGLITWYQAMYEDEEFYDRMLDNYRNLLPYMEELINTGIDEYAAYIRASVYMNDIRWKDQEERTNICNAGHYRSFEANVRHMKYFLAHRLNYLNERWGIEYPELVVPVENERHKVTFLVDDGEHVIWVDDGAILQELPRMDMTKYRGWYFSYSNEEYFDELPIYEDVTFRRKVR